MGISKKQFKQIEELLFSAYGANILSARSLLESWGITEKQFMKERFPVISEWFGFGLECFRRNMGCFEYDEIKASNAQTFAFLATNPNFDAPLFMKKEDELFLAVFKISLKQKWVKELFLPTFFTKDFIKMAKKQRPDIRIFVCKNATYCAQFPNL